MSKHVLAYTDDGVGEGLRTTVGFDNSHVLRARYRKACQEEADHTMLPSLFPTMVL